MFFSPVLNIIIQSKVLLFLTIILKTQSINSWLKVVDYTGFPLISCHRCYYLYQPPFYKSAASLQKSSWGQRCRKVYPFWRTQSNSAPSLHFCFTLLCLFSHCGFAYTCKAKAKYLSSPLVNQKRIILSLTNNGYWGLENLISNILAYKTYISRYMKSENLSM